MNQNLGKQTVMKLTKAETWFATEISIIWINQDTVFYNGSLYFARFESFLLTSVDFSYEK